MPAAWRLAINSLTGRRLRTSLLIAAVALSAGLIVAISCGVASLNAALGDRVASTIGVADARITRAGDTPFDRSLLDTARAWPGVTEALPVARGPVTMTNGDSVSIADGVGVDLSSEFGVRPLRLLKGRAPATPGQIAIEQRVAEELGVGVGDTVGIESYYGGPPTLTVVGVMRKSTFWALAKPRAVLDLTTLGEIVGKPGELSSIDLLLDKDIDPIQFTNEHAGELDKSMLLQPTERITSGVEQNMLAMELGVTVISVIGFMSAALIILTGLTTSVLEQQRELAIVRSVGGSRGQIARAQILVGAIIGSLGAIVGVPLGVALAFLGVVIFHDQLQTGLVVPPISVALATLAAIGTGAVGALWPALTASRISPLEALTVSARKTTRLPVIAALLAGLIFIGGEIALLATASNGDRAFWSYVLGGIELMFIGYFLLGAPIVLTISKLLSPLLARVVRAPRALVAGSVASAPFRYGMTASALMVGLAMMIVIWTEGGAIVKQWLGAIEFPDAFVNGWLGLTPEDRAKIDNLPFVKDTCAITLIEVKTAGPTSSVIGLGNVGTTFVGFEVKPFFRMNHVKWIQGDPTIAKRRLEEGGAVIVAQEYAIAHRVGVGDTVAINYHSSTLRFDIVGVIASPGLEIVSRYFDIGKLYSQRAISSILGSRRDLVDKFGVSDVQLVQINLADNITDKEAVRRLRKLFAGTTLSAGSGREIKRTIEQIANGLFLVMSSVAVAAILIACLGVGNVLIAGIEARRFEFGVLRAVGADGSLLARLVLAETLIMALTAGVLGTLLGTQGAWSELHLYRQLLGLNLALRPPPIPIAIGWGIVIAMSLAAAATPAWRLARRKPRELLASAE